MKGAAWLCDKNVRDNFTIFESKNVKSLWISYLFKKYH